MSKQIVCPKCGNNEFEGFAYFLEIRTYYIDDNGVLDYVLYNEYCSECSPIFAECTNCKQLYKMEEREHDAIIKLDSLIPREVLNKYSF